ncbi:hypothetical protein C8R45DRAFT_927587 [Mycena sanguinolenta]|nr:hypothetical protein C8R45DRAFT_927587 [Mycena sanguinolenta]
MYRERRQVGKRRFPVLVSQKTKIPYTFRLLGKKSEIDLLLDEQEYNFEATERKITLSFVYQLEPKKPARVERTRPDNFVHAKSASKHCSLRLTDYPLAQSTSVPVQGNIEWNLRTCGQVTLTRASALTQVAKSGMTGVAVVTKYFHGLSASQTVRSLQKNLPETAVQKGVMKKEQSNSSPVMKHSTPNYAMPGSVANPTMTIKVKMRV